MAERSETLQGRVGQIEQKLDSLSMSVDKRFAEVDKRFAEVDKRFDEVDKRFDEVSQHFVEQREYTEFAYERLAKEMASGFSSMASRFSRLERKLDQAIDAQSRTAGRRRASRRSRKN